MSFFLSIFRLDIESEGSLKNALYFSALFALVKLPHTIFAEYGLNNNRSFYFNSIPIFSTFSKYYCGIQWTWSVSGLARATFFGFENIKRVALTTSQGSMHIRAKKKGERNLEWSNQIFSERKLRSGSSLASGNWETGEFINRLVRVVIA